MQYNNRGKEIEICFSMKIFNFSLPKTRVIKSTMARLKIKKFGDDFIYEIFEMLKQVNMLAGIPTIDITVYKIVGIQTLYFPYLCFGPSTSCKNVSCSNSVKFSQFRPSVRFLKMFESLVCHYFISTVIK